MDEVLGAFRAYAAENRPLPGGPAAYSSLVAEYLRSAPDLGRCFLELADRGGRNGVTGIQATSAGGHTVPVLK